MNGGRVRDKENKVNEFGHRFLNKLVGSDIIVGIINMALESKICNRGLAFK
jgi:hypothetical protein